MEVSAQPLPERAPTKGMTFSADKSLVVGAPLWPARVSRQLTAEARDKPAMTSLRLLTVLNVGFKYAHIVQESGCRATRASS